MKKFRQLVTLVVASMLLVSCGVSDEAAVASPETTNEVDATTTTVPPTAVQPTTVPPTTAIPTTTVPVTTTTTAPAADAAMVLLTNGGQLDLNSVAGNDTVLWFWAPW